MDGPMDRHSACADYWYCGRCQRNKQACSALHHENPLRDREAFKLNVQVVGGHADKRPGSDYR